MTGISSILKGILKGAVIDFCIFRLHYKLTALVLVAASLLVAWRQQFGTAIDCLARDDIPSTFINDYCYVHSTYSLKESWNKSVGVEIPYPGVDKYLPGSTKVYHTYYQWVSLALFMQAVMFCIPRCYWKYNESKRVLKLLEGVRHGNTELLVNRFTAFYGNNKRYYYHYLLAEILNAVNVIGQIFLTDAFLGGSFLTYGLQISTFTGWNWTTHYDPTVSIFPKLAKCDFFNYGRTGDVQRHDVLCLLPINILNEKIYVLLWFWFYVLGALTCYSVLYEIALLLSKKLNYKKFLVVNAMAYSERDRMRGVVGRCDAGDRFLLRLLLANMSPTNFRDLLISLSQKWEDDVRSNRRDKPKSMFDSDESNV